MSEARFWDIAEELMARPGVEEGTMMGHRCLRVDGQFAAMHSVRDEGLIVKLSEEQVDELVAEGAGHQFAPAGKVFREWVLIPDADARRWPSLMSQAVGDD